MAEQTWFESWFNSSYYKILYQNRDHHEAAHFSDALIAYLQPEPGCRIADIGCGEGRFSIQFAQKGFDVTGVDIAANRIEKALLHEANNLHFFVHDMRQPLYVNYFDLSLNLFTSFGYFDTERDHLKAAQSIAIGLKEGGRLVIDYLNIEWVLQQMKAQETIERSGVRFDIQKEYDHKHIIKHIRFQDEEGVERHYTERVSAFTQADFIHLFEQVGLRLEATFGSYALAPFVAENSERLIMVFIK
jgi:SAM-dependent methyltransferase